MALHASRVGVEFDAASRTLLAEADGVTDAGDADLDINASIAVDRIGGPGGAVWNDQRPGIAAGMLVLNIWVSAMSGDSNVYDFVLFGNDQPDMSGGAAQLMTLHVTSAGGPGLYRAALSADTLLKLHPDVTHIALGTSKSGELPAISYRAWLSFMRE